MRIDTKTSLMVFFVVFILATSLPLYGENMLQQLWKSLKSFRGKFPIYEQDIGNGEIFKSLGPLELYKKRCFFVESDGFFFHRLFDSSRYEA